jgi:hypothetical protein
MIVSVEQRPGWMEYVWYGKTTFDFNRWVPCPRSHWWTSRRSSGSAAPQSHPAFPDVFWIGKSMGNWRKLRKASGKYRKTARFTIEKFSRCSPKSIQWYPMSREKLMDNPRFLRWVLAHRHNSSVAFTAWFLPAVRQDCKFQSHLSGMQLL